MQRHPQIEFQRREKAVTHRMLMVACIVIMGFTGISVRLLWLQVRMHPALEAEAAGLRQVRRNLPAQRGCVWDRNGSLLAQDLTFHDIYADTFHLADVNVVRPKMAKLCGITMTSLSKQMSDEQIVDSYRRLLAETLANRLDVDADELLESLMPGTVASPILVKDLNIEEAGAWQSFLDQNHIVGIYKKKRIERFRPAGDRMTPLLGLVTKEQIDANGETRPRNGADGVEQLMNKALSGEPGFEEIEMDATRTRELPGFAGKVKPPQDGQHMVMTLDIPLQQMLEETLHDAYIQYSPRKIVSVLVEPATGSILAMACEPREQVNKNKEVERRNMAVTDVYEPGSVMKIITLAAAIDSGAVSLGTTFNCHDGEYREPNSPVWLKDHGNYGMLTVKEILAHSSNIGAYMVARSIGRQGFHDYMKKFGLGTRSGLGLPRESPGIMHQLKDWTATSLSRLAMGYEVSVTPLQMTMAVNAIANHGKLMQPRIIDRILSPDRRESKIVEPVVTAQACSPQTAAKMVDALENVVSNGTGKSAAIEGMRVAGKTGTAQLIDRRTGKYSPIHRAVSFAGFAPANNPRLTCLVLMEDPQADNNEDIYGGKLSAPIFADILKKAFNIMSVAPERDLRLTLVPETEGGSR